MAYEMVGLLRMLIDRDGSDLHLAVGNPPTGRVHGGLVHFGNAPLTPEDSERLMKSIASVDNQQELQEVGGSDFGFAFEDIARFRVSIFKQRGNIGLVLRIIPNRIATMEDALAKRLHLRQARSPRHPDEGLPRGDSGRQQVGDEAGAKRPLEAGIYR